MGEVVYFKDVERTVEPDQITDYYALLSLTLGMAGFILRASVLSWLSLLTFISSVTAVKSSKRDIPQLLTSFVLVTISLVANYVTFFKGPDETLPAYALT